MTNEYQANHLALLRYFMCQIDDLQETAALPLSDFTCCRVRPAFGDYFDCLSGPLPNCPYALGFAEGHLCRNPQVEEILARTNREKA